MSSAVGEGLPGPAGRLRGVGEEQDGGEAKEALAGRLEPRIGTSTPEHHVGRMVLGGPSSSAAFSAPSPVR